ncbi:BTB/POZ domain-containing protein [Ditylenchus destructor]|uniref:BTB/POZ domain-containing protein n=1 Tax=Ditylenchus destructor TaxID=166010 RepID=A0AAD4MFX3_9BILA|nr:BTB/POZ domain-containing protein [Ditylenchus destructor]
MFSRGPVILPREASGSGLFRVTVVRVSSQVEKKRRTQTANQRARNARKKRETHTTQRAPTQLADTHAYLSSSFVRPSINDWLVVCALSFPLDTKLELRCLGTGTILVWIRRMSDSADFKNDYTDFVIVAENEWSRRKEERWNVYIDNTLWEIHEDLTEGRNAATISRVVCQLLLPERKRCDAEVLFISNNAVWNKVRVKFETDDENVDNVIYGSHKLVRKNSASYLMLGKSNQKVVIRILEDKQKFLKEFANRSAADVTFVVNGEECKADRKYLAGVSPVFNAMLYGQFAEAQQDKIVLEEIESVGIFKDFLLAVSPLRIQHFRFGIGRRLLSFIDWPNDDSVS